MAYLRLSSPTNDNWTARGERNPHARDLGPAPLRGDAAPSAAAWRRLAARPDRHADGRLGPVAAAGRPDSRRAPARQPARRPADGLPGSSPGADHRGQPRAPPSNHPETWGALPTAVAGPVVATPLADASPPEDTEGCRDAPSLAAQMTCIDPTLREAEQRMAAAYEAVLAAGVSPATLGRSQARWLTTRDTAAQSSPEDLLTTYQQRESQLRSFAVALERRAGSVGLAPPVGEAGEDQPPGPSPARRRRHRPRSDRPRPPAATGPARSRSPGRSRSPATAGRGPSRRSRRPRRRLPGPGPGPA
jgi:uncharacterized protein YecT (DUF1311 family)